MADRLERDSLGEVRIPASAYYGAQTQRSLENFPIGSEKMPRKLICALALIKKAAAQVNSALGLLTAEKRGWIERACDEILDGRFDAQFPLSVWQTGSGTQTNMNLNEVISNRAIELSGGVIGSKDPIHPNDHVNLSQSSNDVFPAAMHIAAMQALCQELLPALGRLQCLFADKVKAFDSIIKIGRTHLMDATPLTLGQEFSAYQAQLENGKEAIHNCFPHLSQLALGGSAVGTGMNTHPRYASLIAARLSTLTGLEFVTAPNKFEALATQDTLVEVSGALKRLAVSLFKIANDVRWLGSGPRCGIGELILPSNEPGSSIMPGKVNPTQCEALMMVAIQVIGNDAAITMAGAQGNLELNVFRPLIIYNLLQSIHLLTDAMESFGKRCLAGLTANEERIASHLNHSLMLATALNSALGYDKTAEAVQKAYRENLTLKQAVLSLGLLPEQEFDTLTDPKKMVFPH